MANTNTHAFTLGLSSGLRSATPLAALAWRGPHSLRRLKSPVGKLLATTVALGEIYGDKQPTTPSRLKPPLLAGRVLLGATAGLLFTRQWSGALWGAAGSLAASFLGYYARAGLTKSNRVSDLAVAFPEDALAIGLAYAGAKH